PKLRTDGIGLLLPDLQKMRQIAAGLQVRFRTEIARGRFDDALVTAKTMFALARHMGEHPTLIGSLVGIAIAFITTGPLEEMLEQPWCPNLYWALTHLPQPLVSLEKGLEGERVIILAELRDLDDTTPMSPEQIGKLIAYIDRLRDFDPNKEHLKTRAWLDIRVKDEKYLAAARSRLVEYGIPAERVARFPADQVILLDERREYEARRDDEMKGLNLPTWEVEAMAAKPKPKPEPALFDLLLPVFRKVRWAQGRLEQKIALLRHVEALRMYAAEHDGKFPQKLEDIAVPLPSDPFSGKPFRYTLDGETAHLRGSPPNGAADQPAFNLHYEISIQK
ncbi:MAG TPA: hypothetical protein VKE74_06535, partial [Gemmataceae bacterium]|nr:hypothetical protein [Gemmataceae bacterium]